MFVLQGDYLQKWDEVQGNYKRRYSNLELEAAEELVTTPRARMTDSSLFALDLPSMKLKIPCPGNALGSSKPGWLITLLRAESERKRVFLKT